MLAPAPDEAHDGPVSHDGKATKPVILPVQDDSREPLIAPFATESAAEPFHHAFVGPDRRGDARVFRANGTKV